MATFSARKTGVRPPITSWEYYVEDKDDWVRYNKIPLKVETKTPGYLWIKAGKGSNERYVEAGSPYKNGEKIKLLDNGSYHLNGEKTIYALVQIGGKKGLLPISRLGKPPKNTTKDEDIALAQLDGAIRERTTGNTGICIVTTHGSHISQMFLDVVGARTNRGTPKSDFAMINSSGRVVAEISHKKAGGPEAFQQYSGVTSKAGKSISEDEIVEDSLRLFVNHYKDITLERESFKFKIPWNKAGKELMNRAIYGPNFGKKFGIDNVNFIGQGQPSLDKFTRQPGKAQHDCLKKCGHIYELSFSSDISMNGDLSHFKSGGYQPYIFARYTGGRNFEVDNEKYTDVRVLIAPLNIRKTAIEI